MDTSRDASPFSIEPREHLYSSPEVVESVKEFLADVEDYDKVAALSEAFVRGLSDDRGHRHLIARTAGDDVVVGVIAINEDRVVELAVSPQYRHAGLAVKLIEGLRDELGITGAIDVWAHGDLPEAQRFVSRLDARRTRELHKMSVQCAPGSPRHALFEKATKDAHERAESLDFSILTYEQACERFGKDVTDEEWLRVNNEAFAWHPEQGGWSLEQLTEARNTAWFDPQGVLMAWKEDGERTHCVGFHWTKIPVDQREVDEGQRAGEVYVVCVADEARGTGMGSAMTSLGIGYLLDHGCGLVELYVEGDNAPAVATYRKLGFDVVHTDVVYRGQL
ncbi:mycothiol synthase [Corynebacterium sp. zg254]|uniref:Mycothiol acetyltransferase n=1 Tax=Corynebacterium zhongnanshanii TaxID=2768834 RepID=A0ABQ6VC31_9CORY|nr:MULTISPECIES: mycothiol synthase [Corynebacterium]KAB3519792.1 mycothiol synthase [Corynebacterium zhongnanshanii]MCR5914719.1 mycothiol synthase [Corynebacterium sp. zg254]